ncbi:MAG: hypothetical protein H6585_02530 [Flavobacteriales bacterium]|nr:hypothetical protein [Flavobacteriales bacterium]MCB9447205.1 hypothetical protein [Flavobacteriales bacterium]
MAAWKFTDDYLKTYPALASSILDALVFSDHALNGNAFTGTLDVNASGAALGTLGLIVNMTEIHVAGTVTNADNTLTVSFQSTDADAFRTGVANAIPIIGGEITKAASMGIDNITKTTDTADDGPTKDQFDLNVELAVGSSTVTIVSQVPMNGGLFSLEGTFENVGIGLDDLNFLMGSLASGNAWFPTEQLGPYMKGQTSFGLLSMGITAFVRLEPSFSLAISSISVSVGISKLPLMGQSLYLDPLAVWVTVVDPMGKAAASWGLQGSVKLLNYANQGVSGLTNPDFVFDFAMTFPNPPTYPNFLLNGTLENPASKSVNVMLQDLLGSSTDVGLSTDLTVNSFEFDTSADVTTGTISEFSTSIAMSGGFGLLKDFDLEEVAISVSYSS